MYKLLRKLCSDFIIHLYCPCIKRKFFVFIFCTAHNMRFCICLNVNSHFQRHIKNCLRCINRNFILFHKSMFQTVIQNSAVICCCINSSCLVIGRSTRFLYLIFLNIQLFIYIKNTVNRSAACQNKMVSLCKHLYNFVSWLLHYPFIRCQKCLIQICEQNFGVKRLLHLVKKSLWYVEMSISYGKIKSRLAFSMKIRTTALKQMIFFGQCFHLFLLWRRIRTIPRLYSHEPRIF